MTKTCDAQMMLRRMGSDAYKCEEMQYCSKTTGSACHSHAFENHVERPRQPTGSSADGWELLIHANFRTVTTDPIARGFCRRGKLEVEGNEGHEQAGKADHTVVPLRQNPLSIRSVSQ